MPDVAEEEDAILEDVKSILQGVDFEDIDDERIKIRELPKVGETLDPVPAILIAPFGDLRSEPEDMEGNATRIHTVQIVLVDAHEGDYATDRAKRQKWHKQVVNAIEKQVDGSWRLGLSNVPSVWDIRFLRAPTFDRGKLAEGYAYLGVLVEFYSDE